MWARPSCCSRRGFWHHGRPSGSRPRRTGAPRQCDRDGGHARRADLHAPAHLWSTPKPGRHDARATRAAAVARGAGACRGSTRWGVQWRHGGASDVRAAGRPSVRRRVLVHGVHVVRQSSSDGRARVHNTFAGIRSFDAPGFIVAQPVGAFAATSPFGWLQPFEPLPSAPVEVR